MSTARENLGAFAFTAISLVVLTVGSALAVGTVHVPVLLVVSVGTVTACSVMLYLERHEVRRLPPPALVLLGLSAWSAIQAIPLPIHVLSAIAPANADVWARALRPLGETRLRAGSISLDPGASLVEALKWFVYALIFIMAQRAARIRSGSAGIAIAFVSAVAVSLVTLVHGLAGATSLFGLYTPEHAVPRWGLPPILNPNNLSGYLNLGVFCGLGLLLERPHAREEGVRGKRAVIGAGVAIVIAVSVLAASRAGVFGLAFGTLALVLLSHLQTKKPASAGTEPATRSRRHNRTLIPAVVAVAGGILLGVVGASNDTWGELRDTSFEKVRLWAWSVPLIEEHPWFGIGRGAFETVFPAYRPIGGRVVFTHAENFVLQWVAEWGAPIAVATLVTLAWMLRPQRLGLARSNARLGAFVGISVLLLQNLVDLALEIPAVAILLFLVLGSLSDEPVPLPADQTEETDYERASPLRRVNRSWLERARRRALAATVFAGGVLTVTLAAVFGRPVVRDERTEIHELYDRTSFGEVLTFAAFVQRLRQAILRHPAEPYFRLVGALAANRTKEANVMPWVASALERDVMCGRAHLVLALLLVKNHAVEQALMELRFAVEDDPELASAVGRTAGQLTSNLDKLERTAPRGGAGAVVFVTASQVFQGEEARELRTRLLSRAIERAPAYPPARVALARELLAAIAAASAPCEGESKVDCLAKIRQEADAIEQSDPDSCEPVTLRADVHGSEGRIADAEGLLALECGRCREKVPCSQKRVHFAAKIRGVEPLAAATRAYLAAICSDESQCVSAHLYLGDVFAGRSNWWLAAEQYSQAATTGRKPDSWLRAADASLKAGEVGRASWALIRARRDGVGNAALESRIEELQKQIEQRDMVHPN